MKFYIILAFVALASVSAEEWKLKTRSEWSRLHKLCDERYQVPDELIKKAQHEKYPPKEVFEVVLCILRGIEVWSDTTGFSTDRIMIGLDPVAAKQNLNKQFLRESIESCNDNNSEGSTPLDWGYRVFKCFRDNEQFFEAMRDMVFVQSEKEMVEEE